MSTKLNKNQMKLVIWMVLLSTSALAQDNWPSFRGLNASGVADGQNLPESWNGETGQNIRWKIPIPGLAHSSPIVWQDKVFVTTAVLRSQQDSTFKHGLYGAGTSANDRSEVHQWKLYCLDARSGKLLWERTAQEGKPRSARHIKSSYANATPATDGRTVVAFFGSEGLYAYDMQGNLKWKKDLGVLDVGAYNAPSYEWGPASSPVIYQGLVIVQCDTQKEDFVLAADIRSGETVWKAERDDLPSWGTPNVYSRGDRHELVTNGSKYIRAYDPLTGSELWRLGGSSQITAPTPVFSDGLIIVASGRRPEKPIFAVRPGARGDITLPDGQTSSAMVAWSKQGRGPYMPTPLIYQKLVYSLNNNGVFDCYELESGQEVYRQRLAHRGGGFSASPVAADGKIYLSSEDGDILVVQAGRRFEHLATLPMGERLMATPAISGATMYVRGEDHLMAAGGTRNTEHGTGKRGEGTGSNPDSF